MNAGSDAESRVMDELGGNLRTAVTSARSVDPPEDRMRDSLSRLEALVESEVDGDSRGATLPSVPSGTRPVLRFSSRLRWLSAIATCAAVTLMVVVAISRPSTSLAEVAGELRLQPWVHVIEESGDGKSAEIWYSPKMDVSARRDAESMEYCDHRTSVYHWYSITDRALFRMLEDGAARRNGYTELAATLPLLLDEGPPTDPLSSIGFLEAERANVQLISQSLSRVTDQGHEMLDYELNVRHENQAVRFVFRVDAESKLPQLCTVSATIDGEDLKREMRFDYPQNGPADIYALGVPRDVQLEDRVPTDDVKSAIAGVTAGWSRFDDYRAVVVHYSKDSESWWTGADIEVIHRKGDRLRRDMLRFQVTEHAPPENVDLVAWWTEESKKRTGQLTTIVHGNTNWRFQSRVEMPENGDPVVVIESKRAYELPLPVFWSLTPDYVARPPMGGPSLNDEVRVIVDPDEGPEGTLLLEQVRTNSYNTASSEDSRTPGEWRKWIDPNRGFLVMRSDIYDPDGETTTSMVVEGTAQSPSGHWYATEIRHEFRQPGGAIGATVYQFHVDFDAEISDALFDHNNAQQLAPLEQ